MATKHSDDSAGVSKRRRKKRRKKRNLSIVSHLTVTDWLQLSLKCKDTVLNFFAQCSDIR